MAQVAVKICGLTRLEDVDAVAAAGARYFGLVFFPKSPRNVALGLAREMSLSAPLGLAKVALVVDPSDHALGEILDRVPIDLVQLHGRETPERVAEIRAQSGLPVMKAVGLADEEDLTTLDAYANVADQLLVDAKPPTAGDLPGGNGLSFDWRLVAGRPWSRPWMLAGGLTPANVAEAIRLSGATQVDVSSGVETAPGVKGHTRISSFVDAAQRSATA